MQAGWAEALAVHFGLLRNHDAQVPSAAAAAGAASKGPLQDGVAGGAVSPAAPEPSSSETSRPHPSQPSMDTNADADGSQAKQVRNSLIMVTAVSVDSHCSVG